MKSLIFILLFSQLCLAKTIHIAVLDTGFELNNKSFIQCIDVEQKNTSNETMNDFVSHGQNVTHIIADWLKGLDYCIVPVKFYTKDGKVTLKEYNEALKYIADNKKIDVVNMSLDGIEVDPEEKVLIKKMIDDGKIVVSAAGNYRKDLDQECNIYPACADERIVVVGCLNEDLNHCSASDYGNKRVKIWEIGENIKAGGVTMSGTSQSCALATAKIVKEIIKKENGK